MRTLQNDLDRIRERGSFKSDCEALKRLTQDCRADFHEPDEAGVEYHGTVGTSLDNAMSWLDIGAIREGRQEATVLLTKTTESVRGLPKREEFDLNLASLIALAAIGAKTLYGE